MKLWLLISIGIVVFCNVVEGHKIIMLSAAGSRSHLNVFSPLLKELSSRGHSVTLVSPMPLDVPKNVKNVVVDENHRAMVTFQSRMFNDSFKFSLLSHLGHFSIFVEESTRNFLEHPFIRKILAEKETYDLAIVNSYMNDVCFVTAPLMAKNVIALSPGASSLIRRVSPPLSLSTFPASATEMDTPMTFFQRIKNVGIAVIAILTFSYGSERVAEGVIQKYLPEALTVQESYKKVSLVLNNADPILSIARSQVATSIDVGGMHCRDAKPLPQEFEDFISDGDFIIFSLGSITPARLMPAEIRNAFISAFSHLRMKVFWKFEEPIDDLPPNVKVSPWLPQQDLLADPRMRLFITHGGALSLQEAMYHGVPMIGIPLFGDQTGNVKRLVDLGIGEKLDLDDINDKKILEHIFKMLYNTSYVENMKQYSSMLRDQMEPPVKRAAYWVEYVIQHNGAGELLMQSDHLLSVEYLSLDVIVSIFVTFILVMVPISMVLKFSARRLMQGCLP